MEDLGARPGDLEQAAEVTPGHAAGAADRAVHPRRAGGSADRRVVLAGRAAPTTAGPRALPQHVRPRRHRAAARLRLRSVGPAAGCARGARRARLPRLGVGALGGGDRGVLRLRRLRRPLPRHRDGGAGGERAARRHHRRRLHRPRRDARRPRDLPEDGHVRALDQHPADHAHPRLHARPTRAHDLPDRPRADNPPTAGPVAAGDGAGREHGADPARPQRAVAHAHLLGVQRLDARRLEDARGDRSALQVHLPPQRPRRAFRPQKRPGRTDQHHRPAAKARAGRRTALAPGGMVVGHRRCHHAELATPRHRLRPTEGRTARVTRQTPWKD